MQSWRRLTNGLSKRLPIDCIENMNYVVRYQVALVLKGIAGTFFWLTIHLLIWTAVVLQEIDEYQEWFHRLSATIYI